MILLDTHVLFRFVAGDPALGARTRDRIEAEDQILVSTISAWEIGMLRRKGRIELDRPTLQWFDDVLSADRMRLVAVELEIAAAAGHLDDRIHGDPGDRILIATALHHDVPLVTADRAILGYAAQGRLRIVDARL